MYKAFKISVGWLMLVMLSPIIVAPTKDLFTEVGWLAIGSYQFDLHDGFLRSLRYFIYTLPVILAVTLALPKRMNAKNSLLSLNIRVTKWPIFAMIVFNIIAFFFDLGITGVETDTGPWRLSGVVHYVRSYLFLGVIAFYVFVDVNYRWKLIVVYSLVAGITSGSRFCVVSPIVVMILKNSLSVRSNTFRANLTLIAALVAGFIVVTTERQILFVDGYRFSKILYIFNSVDIDLVEAVFRGMNELFLRIGIGRDVILAYQVQQSKISLSPVDLFFNAGGDLNSTFYFYGFINDQTRFQIVAPALPSVYICIQDFLAVITILPAYCLWAHYLCKSPSLLVGIPYLEQIVVVGCYLQIVFVTIGPIFFSFIIPFVAIIVRVFYRVVTPTRSISV